MIKYVSNSEFKLKGRSNKNAKPALTKSVSQKPQVLEGRQIKFILSAPMVDRDLDFVDPKGINFQNYLANPVVFWGHEHHSLPIGKCVSIGLEGGALVGVVEFNDPSIPIVGPMSEAIFQLCKAGALNAVSIGFIAKEWEFAEDIARSQQGGTDISEAELLEFSVVGIPCNPGALLQEIAPEVQDEAPREPGEKHVESDVVIKNHRERMMRRLRAAD